MDFETTRVTNYVLTLTLKFYTGVWRIKNQRNTAKQLIIRKLQESRSVPSAVEPKIVVQNIHGLQNLHKMVVKSRPILPSSKGDHDKEREWK